MLKQGLLHPDIAATLSKHHYISLNAYCLFLYTNAYMNNYPNRPIEFANVAALPCKCTQRIVHRARNKKCAVFLTVQ